MEPRSVLITGTTSGVGRALLEHYVRRGVTVVAVNRRPVPALEADYPGVRFACVDVRDTERVAQLVDELAASGALPEIFLLNAGINRVDNDEAFQVAPYREVMETNLFGVLNFVAPLTRLPPGPVARHVVALGSMVRYAGNPHGLGYLTSKRALADCFAAWSGMYAGTDLVFQQVLLGPVRTAIYTMADRFPAWMGWLKDRFSAPLDGTARAIARFARTRRRTLRYPRPALLLFLAMRLGQGVGFFRGRRTLAGKPRRTG